MSPERLVAAHLAATRITHMEEPLDGPLAGHYRAWHAELTDRLVTRFDDLEPAPLFVTCTANARSELLSGAGWRTIVHDQHLGRTLNRMTYFVLNDWPSSRVQAWAFERLATAALGRGDIDATQLALALSAGLSNLDEPPTVDPARDAARAVMVTIQEFFVLAHEVAHTALGEAAHARLEGHLRDELETAFEQRTAVLEEQRDAIADQMARDVAEAVSRHLGAGAASAEDLERLRDFADVDGGLDEAAWLRTHPFLYEELACDLIATELTLEHFQDIDPAIDLRTVLPAVLMALHHLTSLEYLGTISDVGALDIGQTLGAAMVRKSVWRDLTRKMYEAGSDVHLGRLYVDVTQDHAHKLGDQVLFIVPTIWREARAELDARREGTDASEPKDIGQLRDLVWSFARPR